MSNIWSSIYIVLTIIFLIGLGSLVLHYLQDIRAARKRVESLGSQVVETSSGKIEYALAGEGYPVLVVHGAIGGFDQGLYLAQILSPLKVQIVSISRIGHLGSPLLPDANLDVQADLYAGLLDELQVKQAVVYAISAGSTSAIRFAARYPERVSALVLLGPDAPGKAGIFLPPRFIFDFLFRSNFIYWILITYFKKSMYRMMGLMPRGFIPDAEHLKRINDILLGDLPIDQRIDGLIFETYTTSPEFYASVTESSPYPLSNIHTPVLVINALDDPIITAENVRNLAEKFPNVRQYITPDGGHLFFNHEKEVQSEIAQFLLSTIPELKGKSSMN